MAGQVKIDCPRLPVPFTYTGNLLYHRGPPRTPRRVRGGGGQVSGIAGGYETFSAGVSGLVKKPRLYPRKYTIPLLPKSELSILFTSSVAVQPRFCRA